MQISKKVMTMLNDFLDPMIYNNREIFKFNIPNYITISKEIYLSFRKLYIFNILASMRDI